MPRRGENIYKRKDGRWEGRYIKGHSEGKIQYGYVYARTYNEVKAKLSISVIENISLKKTEVQDSYYYKNDNFSDVSRKWFEFIKPQLKESSVVKYTNVLKTYLLPEFEKKNISDISRDDINKFCSNLMDTGGVQKRGLSSRTVTNIMSVLRNIFKYASRYNNCHVIDLHDITIRQTQPKMRILTNNEQQKLNDYLYSNLDLFNLGILLCMYTGLRIGEICALKWEDIDFDEKLLHVHMTMQRLQNFKNEDKKTTVVISNPKSDCSVRKIPLPDEIFRLLFCFKQPDNTFFLTGNTNKFIEPRTMQNHFKSIIKKCGLEDANFHALRHTFATRCVEFGFDMKSLSEILGHASVNITLNRYVHPSMELKQKNMNMLSELITVR